MYELKIVRLTFTGSIVSDNEIEVNEPNATAISRVNVPVVHFQPIGSNIQEQKSWAPRT